MSRSLAIPKKNGQMYFNFVVRHCINEDAAKEAKLLISVVARPKKVGQDLLFSTIL